jgi:hypothetical protein
VPKIIRKLLLNYARKIVEAEGLTCADIREIAGNTYIVDKQDQFYLVSAAPRPPSEKKQSTHSLRLIK